MRKVHVGLHVTSHLIRSTKGVTNALHIRSTIAQARNQEAQTHHLERYIQNNLDSIHHLILVEAQDKPRALFEFVVDYIEHVPDFLEALRELSLSAGINNEIEKFLQIAESFFVEPPELVTSHEGMLALIDEAYLAHRLIEEINDRIMLCCGLPMAPMDMTISNLIVHELLGENFANELDLAVHYSVEALFNDNDIANNQNFQHYLLVHKEDGWLSTIREWPCLAGDSCITLNQHLSLASSHLH